MKLFLVAPLILLEFIFLQSASQGLGIVAVDKKICLQVQKAKVPVSRLKSYIHQTLPIEAILFATVKNKELCADPSMDWVKKAVAELDKRANSKNGKNIPPTNNKNGKKAPLTKNKRRSRKTPNRKQKTQRQQVISKPPV